MTVSRDNSKAVYEAIKSAGIRFLSALPETWLVYLLQLAEDDPEMTLVEVAKEEEAIGIAAGCHFVDVPNALLMQNHGFMASINGIVSLSLLYRIPMLMIIAHRGHIGEHYPWHTQGGIMTEPLLRSMNIPYEVVRKPQDAERLVKDGLHYAQISLSPTALLLPAELMEAEDEAG